MTHDELRAHRREQRREAQRRYRAAHPERARAHARKKYERHREDEIDRVLAYYYDHLEEMRAKARARYWAKKAKV